MKGTDVDTGRTHRALVQIALLAAGTIAVGCAPDAVPPTPASEAASPPT